MIVKGEVDYLLAHINGGYYELEVDRIRWGKLSPREKKDLLKEKGELIIKDITINDIGEIRNIEEVIKK